MTIAQALRRIAKLKGEHKELLERAAAAVSYPIKQPPAFEFPAMMEQAQLKRAELVGLEAALRVTNAMTKVEFSGRTASLTEATIVLQEYKSHIAWLRGLAVRAHEQTFDESFDFNDEMKRVKTVTEYTCELPEAKRAALVAETQTKFDDLNDIVESVNHRTSLIKQ